MTLFMLASLVAAAISAQDSRNEVGWVQLPVLTREVIECAKYSDTVIPPAERGSIRLDRRNPAGSNPNTNGPGLPFDAGPAFQASARWVSLQLTEGWLVGRDKGEWGGGLWWFRLDHSTPVQLLDGNVSYIGESSFGPYAIAEIPPAGEDVMTLASMRRDDRGDWVVDRRYEFAGEALALLDKGDGGVYVLSRLALLHWNGRSIQTLLSGLESVHDLDPHELAVDEEAISVSMRLLRLMSAKDGTQPRWLIPAQCSTFEMREITMVQAGLTGKVPSCVCTGTRQDH